MVYRYYNAPTFTNTFDDYANDVRIYENFLLTYNPRFYAYIVHY